MGSKRAPAQVPTVRQPHPAAVAPHVFYSSSDNVYLFKTARDGNISSSCYRGFFMRIYTVAMRVTGCRSSSGVTSSEEEGGSKAGGRLLSPMLSAFDLDEKTMMPNYKNIPKTNQTKKPF